MIDELQHLAESRSGTFPQITFNSELATKVINLPTRVIQKKIISILDAIEEKIDKNLQINDNLPLHQEWKDAKKVDCGGNEETAELFSSLSMAA